MRASRALAVTATAFAAVGLAAPLAAAGGVSGSSPTSAPTNVTVNPSSVHQGATMQVSAEGCGRAGGKVWSNAFPTVNLSPGRVGFATARIRDDATPGRYNLSVKCNEDRGVGGGDGNGARGDNADRGNGGDRGGDNAADRGNDNGGDRGNNAGGDRGNDNGADRGGNNGADRGNSASPIATQQFTVLPGEGAQGGLGGSMGPSSIEMRIGAGLVAAAAVGGAVFIVRRRRSGDAAV